MSNLGRLPDEPMALLDGTDLESRHNLVFELLTVSDEGWPHVALLSVGEILAPTPDRLMLALWSGSTTTGNLNSSGRAVLQTYHGGAAYRIRLACRAVAHAPAEASRLAVFDCHVDEVRRDAVAYATLISGPLIELLDPEAVVERWAQTVAMLREAAG